MFKCINFVKSFDISNLFKFEERKVKNDIAIHTHTHHLASMLWEGGGKGYTCHYCLHFKHSYIQKRVKKTNKNKNDNIYNNESQEIR